MHGLYLERGAFHLLAFDDVGERARHETFHRRVELARILFSGAEVLILDEPTRGIDVGAKAEIYRLISFLASEGMAVIMISSELPEVLGMSDRVMVMHEGELMGTLDRSEATQEKVMHLASGMTAVH